MPTVVLIGTLDTKGTEYGFLRSRLERAGVETVLVDCGVRGAQRVEPDFDAAAVAEAAGTSVTEERRACDEARVCGRAGG